jgi:hypothetical protein
MVQNFSFFFFLFSKQNHGEIIGIAKNLRTPTTTSVSAKNLRTPTTTSVSASVAANLKIVKHTSWASEYVSVGLEKTRGP